MTTLKLNDGMHLCEAGGRFVVLDLPHDRYHGLTRSQGDALRAVISDTAAGEAGVQAENGPLIDALEPLINAGVLTTSLEHGRAIETTTVEPPDTSFLEATSVAAVHVSVVRLVRLVSAAATAQRHLHRHPIQETVAHVRRRSVEANVALDLDKACDLTRAFLRLRPFYPLNYRCLFDSLALIEFLARWDVHPTWVFGVRLDPWKAHCWIQHGRVLFNDDLDEVLQFTPIMAV